MSLKRIANGIFKIHLKSWADFHDFVRRRTLRRTTLLYRGQMGYRWKLDSSIDRMIAAEKPSQAKRAIIKKHLKDFKMASRGRCNLTERDDENEWWAFGRHWGLATPLIDWSRSPYIALFFAYAEEADGDKVCKDDPRVVFVLDQLKIERICNERREEGVAEEDLIQFVEPFSHHNRRLLSQSGMFTRSPYGWEIEEWIKKQFSDDPKQKVLRKILVPGKDRNDCLRALNRMSINYLSLFPDAEGSARHCNLKRQIRAY